MDAFRVALAGITTVLQQQIDANTPRTATLDPFNLLEKFTKLKAPKFTSSRLQMEKFKGVLDPLEAEEWIIQMEKLFDAMLCPEEDKI